MARLTIAWVKEYAKANGIFLVKTSTGYAVQYQRLIDELTYEDSVGYKEVFKTLKEVKNWIDDQNPVDVLGIDKEVAKEIYEDAKNFSDKDDRKDALNNITANTSLRFITAQSLVFGDVEKVISDLSHNRCNALSVFEGIGVLREYTFIHPMTLDRLNEKVNDYLLTLHPETKEEDKEESFNEVREYALAEIKEEVKTPLETYVDDVESRENWILSLTEDELDSSGLSDQEVEFWVKNQNKNEVKEITFEEVRDFALNCGYELTESAVCGYCNFTLYSTNRAGEFTELVDIVETIKDGRLLNSEFCDLPLPKSLKITPTHKLISLANGELTMVKDFNFKLRSAIAKLPFKFIGMDENKLCFELEDGDREYLARAIDLNYLKSHQSVIQDPNFTDHMKWESFNDLMGEVLSKA